MLEYGLLQFNDDRWFKKKGKKNKVTSDTIYTFDIEVSSLFRLDGKWQAFDYDRPQIDYSGIDKAGVPYIWMFGVNDMVYYGRDFKDFKKVLLKISDIALHKIIWVHNLSYEFQFLLDIISEYTIDNMCCRDALKPISFNIKELNIEFRCSYMLTNMSLDKAVKKEKGTKYLKMVGDLDYSKFRTPYTPLTYIEWGYFIGDLLSLYDLIRCKLENEQRNLFNLPLTSTGYIREYLRNRTRQDKKYYWFFHKFGMTSHFYDMCKDQLKGGDTHANRFYQGKIV